MTRRVLAVVAVALPLMSCTSWAVDKGEYRSLDEDEAAVEERLTSWMEAALGSEVLVADVYVSPIYCDSDGWHGSLVEIAAGVSDAVGARERLVAWVDDSVGGNLRTSERADRDRVNFWVDGDEYFVHGHADRMRAKNLTLGGWTGCYDIGEYPDRLEER